MNDLRFSLPILFQMMSGSLLFLLLHVHTHILYHMFYLFK